MQTNINTHTIIFIYIIVYNISILEYKIYTLRFDLFHLSDPLPIKKKKKELINMNY